jgi:hypothetical protein
MIAAKYDSNLDPEPDPFDSPDSPEDNEPDTLETPEGDNEGDPDAPLKPAPDGMQRTPFISKRSVSRFYLAWKAAMQNVIGLAICRSSVPELFFFHLNHISARGILPTCALRSRRLWPAHPIHISHCA